MLALLLIISYIPLLWLIWRLRFQPRPPLDPPATASDSTSSSSSIPTPSSSNTSGKYTYKVFLSFRGEDTRHSFLGHLYKELRVKGIHTFKDDPALKRGDSISPALLDAISGSAISVVLLSENYAYSGWCLDELVHIMKCRKSKGQIVVPIFYKVDPADIKQQRGSFGDALRAHVERVKHKHNYEAEMAKVKRWSDALTQVATHAGWVSRGREEATLIEHIVRDISDKLICYSSSEAQDLVGIGSQVKKIENMLDNQRDVKMIGIWGMGGIGKTTLARVVYDKIRPRYEACCFLRDVKAKYKAHGAVSLQKELLSKLLLERNLDIWPLDDDESNIIQDRISGKKVLMVLDDVDSLDQLKALARSSNWFGSGSTIIITTEDKHCLELHKVDDIYQVLYLGEDDAFKLFSKHAFQQYQIKQDFSKLATKFVAYAKGLPLALKVVGSFLYGRSISVWQDELNKLRSIPEAGLFDVLEASFNALEDNEKDVFLVLGIFFINDEIDSVRSVLQGCGLFPDRAFSILINRALISLRRNHMIVMHDMLQQMGRKIACHDSAKSSERRWLWRSDDVQYVLTRKKGTELIRGISLNLSEVTHLKLEEDAFIGMDRLQFLKIYGSDGKKVHLPKRGIQINSQELVYLHWDGYTSKSLPIRAQNIVELNLPKSKIKRLWEGPQEFINLRKLNFQGSKYLTMTPDLSMAKKIKEIHLSFCESLVEIHSSFEHMQQLVFLYLVNCRNLKTVPSRLNSKVLEVLDLTRCSQLRKCRELVSEKLCLLDFQEIGIEQLPENLSRLTNLTVMFVGGCKHLLSIPVLPPKLTLLAARDCCSLQYFHPCNCSISGAHEYSFIDFDFGNCFTLCEQARSNIISVALSTFRSTKEGNEIRFVLPSIEIPPSFPNQATGCSITIQASPEFMTARMLLCCVVFESEPENDVYVSFRCRFQLKGDSNQPGHFAYQKYDLHIRRNSPEQMILCSFDIPEALHQCAVGDEILFEFVLLEESTRAFSNQVEVLKSCAIVFLPSREDG